MSSKGNVLRKSTSQEAKIRDERKKLGKKDEEKKLPVKKTDSTLMKETKSSSRRAVSNQTVSSVSASKSLSGSRTTQGVASGARSKLTKQASEEKRGVSTIFMPSKKSSTSKFSNKKDVKPKSKERVPSRERKKSRTLSPSEVKMLNRNLNKDVAAQEPEYEYEDDFEDYESDFQECTDSEASQVSDESESASIDPEEPVELQPVRKPEKIVPNVVPPRKYVEEEHMLDSGHYELQEARRRAARIDLMSASRSRNPPQAIQRPIVFNDDNNKPSEIKSLPSSADEGFEDGRSGDFGKSPVIPSVCDPAGVKKKNTKLWTRGKQILQMIKLDVVEWSLFECTPVAYEEFIRIHGKINTRQTYTQTNEDNLSVEVQTEDIESRSMWTQFPVVCRSDLKTGEDIKMFTRELIGVGGEDAEPVERGSHDILQLNEFLSNAGKLMLALLEGKASHVDTSLDVNEVPMPFSDQTIKLSVANVNFLSNRPVTMIRYSEISSRILLTVHEPADEDIETAASEFVTDCCIGCRWNVGEPSRPTKIFYSSSNISACCFHPTNYNIVFAGLEDGSISLWDLGEDEDYHRRVLDNDKKINWVVRSPTFNTGGSFEETSSKIVALTVMSKVESETDGKSKFMPIQICSLDEDGSCVVWSVLKNFEGSLSNHLGQSWWGKLKLVKSHEVPMYLDKHFKLNNFRGFTDVKIDSLDTDCLYVASNVNRVLHATRIGKKPQPLGYNATGQKFNLLLVM